VTAVESVYPRAGFVTGRGAGRTREAAEAAAVADIARVFGVSVSSNVSSKESLHSENGASTEARELNSETLTRTYIQLFNLRYAEPWWNGRTRQWETAGYINREEAWQIYEPRLKQSLDVFSNLTEAAGRERDATKRYRLLSRAQGISGETTQMLNYASVLAPEQSESYQSLRKEIAALPAELARLAGELGIDESRSGNRIETLNYFFSAVTYDPTSAEALNRLNEELLDLGVGARIRNEFERQVRWKKDLDDFSAFYLSHPPFQLYFTQFGSPPVLYYEDRTFDLDFYSSLRRGDEFRAMQKVFDNLSSQLKRTGKKEEWGFASWPKDAPVFNSNAGNFYRRTFRFTAGLFNERNELLSTTSFDLSAALRLSGDEKKILVDSSQNVRVFFSRVKYDPNTLTDNLLVRIISVDDKDVNEAGLEGYINIIPVASMPAAQVSTLPPERFGLPAAQPEKENLFLGIRAGAVPRSYTLNTTLDLTPDGHWSFTGAVSFSWQFARVFNGFLGLGLQTEIGLGGDRAAHNNNEFSSLTMEIPLLFRINFYFNENFYCTAFGGPYIAVPVNAIYTKNEQTEDITLTPFFGLAGGAAIGCKLGPGAIFLDVRYSGDFNFTRLDDVGQYRRGSVPISAGYEFWF
jgi:hypothetical protein